MRKKIIVVLLFSCMLDILLTACCSDSQYPYALITDFNISNVDLGSHPSKINR